MRLNEEEKILQSEILHFHKEHKDLITESCLKHKIKILDANYPKHDGNSAEEHP